MAKLVFVSFDPHSDSVKGCQLQWVNPDSTPIARLPVLIWRSHISWGEANVWALELARSRNPKTALSELKHICAYANWLESTGIDWWHFPNRRIERCLYRFRATLISARDAGDLMPSTASARMASVIRFYRWLQEVGLIATAFPMWTEIEIRKRVVNKFGFEHALEVASTELSIPNLRTSGAYALEDGVMPVTVAAMRAILEFALKEASTELHLMLLLGFGTGLRLGSILDLKVETLQSASIDIATGSRTLSVGPSARPPVATKFGAWGNVLIPEETLEAALRYVSSARRLKRCAMAAPEDRNHLFLTRFGKRYAEAEYSSINVEMHRLRASAKSDGLEAFNGFYFHRSRATFATLLTKAALRHLPLADAIDFVRRACLHRNEKTTQAYIHFAKSSEAMAEAAEDFSRHFRGANRV